MDVQQNKQSDEDPDVELPVALAADACTAGEGYLSVL